MRHWAAFTLAALTALAAGAVPARAQAPYPGARPNYGVGFRPGLSPYLDITRGGSPAINYYLGTRPEFQRRYDAAQFRTELRGLETRVATPAGEEEEVLGRPTVTGHVTAFNNTAGYFNSMAPPAGTLVRARPGAGAGKTPAAYPPRGRPK